MKRLTVIAAMAAVFLAGCLPLPDRGDARLDATPSDAPSAPKIATSPDQTISVTLPAGWRDFSSEYLDALPTSVLSAFWGAGKDMDQRGAPFASVSTRPVSGATGTAKSLAAAGAAEWQRSMDGEITDEGSFDTREGGEGYWHRIEGIEQGKTTTIINVSILSNGRSAKISIETYPDTPELGEALLEALDTVTLAPLGADETPAGEVIGGVYTDGSVVMTVPTQWSDPLPADSLLESAAAAEAHLYGTWLLGTDALGTPAYVVITVNDAVAGLDRAQRSKEEWGAPGSLIPTAGGEVIIVSVADVAYPNGAAGVIGCIGDPAEASPAAQQCDLIFALGDYFVSARVVGVGAYPEAVDQAGEAIASLRVP